MTDEITRLFGIPGSESLYLDIETVYETEADFAEPGDRPNEVRIQEWTVRDPRVDDHALDAVIEDLVERMAEEGDENYAEQWDEAGQREDVRMIFRQAADAMASHVTYRMADEHVTTHIITFDPEGRPLLNGELLYVEAETEPG